MFGIRHESLAVDILISTEIVTLGYTYTKYAEMILIYNERQRNARAAARAYLLIINAYN